MYEGAALLTSEKLHLFPLKVDLACRFAQSTFSFIILFHLIRAVGWVVQEKHQAILKGAENKLPSVPKLFCFLLSPKFCSCHPSSQTKYSVTMATVLVWSLSSSRLWRQVRKDVWTLRLTMTSLAELPEFVAFNPFLWKTSMKVEPPLSPGVTFPAGGIAHFGWTLGGFSRTLITFPPPTKMASFNPAIICIVFFIFWKLHFSGNEERARG